jgi:hypothetical protein
MMYMFVCVFVLLLYHISTSILETYIYIYISIFFSIALHFNINRHFSRLPFLLCKVQAGITANIIQSVWIKTIEATPPTKASDAKVCCLGIVRMLTESSAVQGNEACWSVLLGSLVSVLDPNTAVKVEEKDDEEAFSAEAVAFDGDSFSKLHFTGGSGDEDPYPEVCERTCYPLCVSTIVEYMRGSFLFSFLLSAKIPFYLTIASLH